RASRAGLLLGSALLLLPDPSQRAQARRGGARVGALPRRALARDPRDAASRHGRRAGTPDRRAHSGGDAARYDARGEPVPDRAGSSRAPGVRRGGRLHARRGHIGRAAAARAGGAPVILHSSSPTPAREATPLSAASAPRTGRPRWLWWLLGLAVVAGVYWYHARSGPG